MLTDRGRFALAVGGAVYLAGWAFGSVALYPIAIGLVVAVLAAIAWVRPPERISSNRCPRERQPSRSLLSVPISWVTTFGRH